MKCKLVVEDWMADGRPGSIYNTELGVELSTGDLHSGTTFVAEVDFPPDVAQELYDAYYKHHAYPVFRVSLVFPSPTQASAALFEPDTSNGAYKEAV
jgi:hypothetical protein